MKKSEKSLAEAQKIAHLGNWEWNIKTDKINWSEETYHIFGRNPQEFGANYEASLSYIHPDDRLSVNNAVIEALNGKRYNIEFRIILANGENRVVHAKGETSFDENNTPVRLFGTVQDITDRKRTEEALRESEERFNLAVKAAQEGVWDWNMETDEVWYSSRYKEMLGYSDEEIEHHVSACLRLLHPDDKERSLQLVNAVMRGERNYELEFRLRHKDGHYLNILSRGYPVRRESDGKIVRIVGIHLDLTERKIAEEKLRESEEKYRNIVETANESICLINSEGVLTYVNKKMADMTGYTIGEIIGRTIWDFVGKEDQSTVTMNMEKRRRGISESYEIKLIRKDGSPFWVHVNVKE
jgi:PAS domain S-box-containing protein